MFYTVYRDSLSSVSFSVNGQNFARQQDVSVSSFTYTSGEWKADSIVFAGFGITDSAGSDFKNLPIKNKWVLIAK